MFRFEHPYFLYALFAIPILVVGYILLHYKTKRKLTAYSDFALLNKLLPARSNGMRIAKFALSLLALAALIFTIANPQVGTSFEKGKRKGVDIMICLDVSNSMMAEDIKPNRLMAAKLALSRFIDNLQGDRIGLVAFAGKAFVQLPITSDYAAAKMFIDRIETKLINEQGTDIANALDLAAVAMLPEEKEDDRDIATINKLTSKVIVVVSDGEDQFEEAIEMAEKVHKMHITIHTIGIGSTSGTFIPERDRNGNISYKKDAEGNTVTTHLNEEILRNVAAAGAGTYVHADNANVGFDAILDKINAMTKSDLDDNDITFARYESRFQYPLALALLFIFVETLLFGTQQRWRILLKNLTQSWTMKTVILFIISILAISHAQAQTDQELLHIRNGIALYEQAEKARQESLDLLNKGGEVNKRNANDKMKTAEQKYKDAEEQFRKSLERNPNWDKANYNLGNVLYRQGRYEEAAKAFQKVAQQQGSPLQAQAYHNTGNIEMQQKQYQKSIDAYKNALRLNPKDMDTKYNLEYARKMLVQQQQQQNNQQQNQQQQQQNNQQQQQQQQQQQNKQNNSNQQQDNQNKNNNQQNQPSADPRKQQENKRQLDALQQNERRTQEKVQQQENKHGVKVRQEKDW